MKVVRRLFTSLVALFLSFILVIPALASTTSTSSSTTLTLEQQFSFLNKKGILVGKVNDKAQLNKHLTREAAADALYRLYHLKVDQKAKNPFKDINGSKAKTAILAVHFNGIIASSGNKFSPQGKVTLEQLASYAVLAAKWDTANASTVGINSSATFKDEVALAVSKNILDPASNYKNYALRSHFVKAIYELYKLKNNIVEDCTKESTVKSTTNVSTSSTVVTPPTNGIVAGTLEPSLQYKQEGNCHKFAFTVKNQTEKEQTLTFSTLQQVEYKLMKEGQVIQQFTKTSSVSATAIVEVKLKQGETKTWEVKFANLTAGKYKFDISLAEPNWPNAKATYEFEVK